MIYAKVKDGKIVKIVGTDKLEKLDWTCNNEGCEGEGEWIKTKPLPDQFECKVGDDVRMFDEAWALRPLSELVDEGFIHLTTATEGDGLPTGTVLEKVESEQIVRKTKYDFVKEGATELGSNEYIDEERKEVLRGDDDKLLEVGRIDKQEHYDRTAARVRGERGAKIRAFGWRYARLASQERIGVETVDSMAALDEYMQALRDVPQQEEFPYDVRWPEEPGELV